MDTSPATLTTRQREEKALSLRLGGATFEQIGAAVGLTGPGARAAMMRALRRYRPSIYTQRSRRRCPAIEERAYGPERLDAARDCCGRRRGP